MKNPMTSLAAESFLAESQRESQHVALVGIHFDLLAKMLGFPEGTVIESVRSVPDQQHAIEIRLTHPDLPLVHESQVIIRVNPTYTRQVVDGKTRWDFVNWGQRGAL
jgi:hypothetical protein